LGKQIVHQDIDQFNDAGFSTGFNEGILPCCTQFQDVTVNPGTALQGVVAAIANQGIVCFTAVNRSIIFWVRKYFLNRWT
jgi:hypothetical protein